jgi:hypothetical protein
MLRLNHLALAASKTGEVFRRKLKRLKPSVRF